VIVTRTADPQQSALWGKSIDEISRDFGQDPYDVAISLVAHNCGKGSYVTLEMSEGDIKAILGHPGTVVGSDGQAGVTAGGSLSRLPHPRSFGTFPRVLGRYAVSQGLFSLEEGVRRMTGATADFMGLDRRGYLRDGYWADLVLLDPAEICDNATYSNPYAHAAGIRRVYVNGALTWNEGVASGARNGRVLRR
jgi:N-acyl-D-amino-acid deacylase